MDQTVWYCCPWPLDHKISCCKSFQCGTKVPWFFQKAENSGHQGSIKAEFLKMDGEKNWCDNSIPVCCQRCIKQNGRHFKQLLYYNTLYISISVFLFSVSVLLLFPCPSNVTFEMPVYCSIIHRIIKQIFLLE